MAREAQGWSSMDDTTDRQGRTYEVTGDYRYRIRATGMSSARLGACEVCGGHCSEAYHQVEQVRFIVGGVTRWTHYKTRDLFGHEPCLRGQRRAGVAA